MPINVEEKLTEFMTSQYLFEFDEQITTTTDLFEQGIIDSYGFIELISFLEKEFNIILTNDELLSGSLNSFNGIISTIWKKNEN